MYLGFQVERAWIEKELPDCGLEEQEAMSTVISSETSDVMDIFQ
ncbi:hypothetical protein TNCV_2871511, partial [Trichonephila clavipes]